MNYFSFGFSYAKVNMADQVTRLTILKTPSDYSSLQINLEFCP